ncbi:DUF937 domain-containing protein [Xenophilus azovorans]|uniref:DUF937 domain-containing protein n=1 Tax=Xenophilus azovorans TaxID=151755 RepID=UPI0005719B1F|nr:DUF937 domain-containing protein [Xenophilus azovorans]
MNASDSLTDDLFSQLLQGGAPQQIAGQIGADADQTRDAIGAALPMLLGALGRNAQQPQGAADLFGALQRDHAGEGSMDLGSLLGGLMGGGAGAAAGGMGGLGDLLGSVLGGGGAAAGRQLDGGGILGHIFGDAQPRAESGLGQATGLGAGQAGQLLKILAPIVMAFLAKRASSGGMDAGSLGGMLGQESSRIQNQGGLGGGLLGAVLDQNGDGQLDLGDLLKIGGSLLGGRR